jgi:uncharacterized membrane protein (GlpM family)
MFLAQRLEMRLGPAAAGWFAALPIAFGVATATIALTSSAENAALVSLSAVGHVGPMVAYAIASILVIPVPEIARVTLGVLAIALGTWFMSRQPRATHIAQAASTTQQMLSLASAGVVVGLITVADNVSGPDLAGALGAFPTMSTTIALFIAYRSGVRNANSVMRGLMKSLPIYVTYSLVFALLILNSSALWAIVGSVVLSLIVAMVTWRKVERTDITENGVLYSEP